MKDKGLLIKGPVHLFISTGKQSVSEKKKITNEAENAVKKIGQELRKFIKRKQEREKEKERSEKLQENLEIIAKKSEEITDEENDSDYEQSIKEIVDKNNRKP